MKLRRSTSGELRLDLTPLIDVVFLLLTYFIFAMILMIRADVLNVSLPTLGAAGEVNPGVAITVAVDAEGGIFINGEAAELDTIGSRIDALRSEAPDARVLLAVDVGSTAGAFLSVTDALLTAGISDFSVLAQPGEGKTP